MKEIKPISTSIKQIIELGAGKIIREDYYQFQGKSNIYFLKNNEEILWFAELPQENDFYSNNMVISNQVLSTSTWEGITVKISLETGKILREDFTK